MLNKYQMFLVKKGLRLLIRNPKSVWYKYKQIKNNSIKTLRNFDYSAIHSIDYLPAVIEFRVEIIIPIYNGYECLTILISQLLSHQHLKYKLILINDCSSDERIKLYLHEVQNLNTTHQIEVISSDENHGFVHSVNLGMQHVQNHFIILNTDTEIPTYFANKILAPIMDQPDKVASVTPFTNSGEICSFPQILRDNEPFLNLDVETIDNVFSQIDAHKDNIKIPTGVGFCMAINYHVYKQIGGFDEKNFGRGYAEENDWCMRAAKLKYVHLQAVNCFVYHKHGGSFSSKEKQQLVHKNVTVLEKLHPAYIKLKHKFFAEDPGSSLRLFLRLQLIAEKFNTICIFNSVQTGGASMYVKNLITKKLNLNCAVILVESQDFLTICTISIYYDDKTLQFTAKNVFLLLAKLKLNQIIINHMLFNPDITLLVNQIQTLIASENNHDFTLQEQLQEKELALESMPKTLLQLVLHDYMVFCPTITLLNYANNFCGLPTDSAICNECLYKFRATSIASDYVDLYKVHDIDKWRVNFEKLFSYADEIIVPSDSVIQLLNKIYGQYKHKYRVVIHDVTYLDNIANHLSYTPGCGKQVTLMTMGNLTPHKGSNIIYQVLKLARQNNINIKWVVLGGMEPYKKVKNLVVERYNIHDLPRLINHYQPDIFVLPSIWPETFSYVISEMMHFDLPIISFALGAQGDRVSKYRYGKVVDKITPNALLDAIINISQSYASY